LVQLEVTRAPSRRSGREDFLLSEFHSFHTDLSYL
jgi:hypothetical protein